MYLTVKQRLKHLSKDEYQILRELCRTSKNLMNEAIYINRQYFFIEGKYLGYEKTYAMLKASENYRVLNSNMAQQSMKVVDGMFASFIALLKLVKRKQYDSRAVKIPRYLPKDGYAPPIIQQFTICNHIFTLPYSRQYGAEHSKITVKVPPTLESKKVKYIRIIPLNNARFFEIQYTYEAVEAQRELDKQKYGKKPTFRQKQLARKRKLRINDYISKAFDILHLSKGSGFWYQQTLRPSEGVSYGSSSNGRCPNHIFISKRLIYYIAVALITRCLTTILRIISYSHPSQCLAPGAFWMPSVMLCPFWGYTVEADWPRL